VSLIWGWGDVVSVYWVGIFWREHFCPMDKQRYCNTVFAYGYIFYVGRDTGRYRRKHEEVMALREIP
jgi:hypothetical protein